MEAEMRVPKLKDSLCWGERKKQKISSEDTHILSSAMSNLNKFADDGSFLFKFMHPPKSDNSGDSSNSNPEAIFNELRPLESKKGSEYDYDNSSKRKTRKKGIGKSANVTNFVNRILTQQDRCKFCFENPTRPKHLVVAIANFTYLSLPQWQPIVPGHCCILTLHHESATRSVDNNVWEEIRNFKKGLIMMLAKQEKDVVFLETVMGLAKQRRHCLVECIPLPQDVAKQAPLYFKKAIDEAEDEWSQHSAKKVIDTSIKGLRASIPKDFPYFHVEFGLNRGFVHVIEDEKGFKSSFGLDVVRGMLKLGAEDMHSHGKCEFIATQKQVVASFARDWNLSIGQSNLTNSHASSAITLALVAL